MTLGQESNPGRRLTVAMDGPAGAGKTTLARQLADQLGYLYVDTGAMYRALTLKAIWQGIDLGDPAALEQMAAQTLVQVERGLQGNRIFLDGEEVTGLLRQPDVEKVVSRVSAVKGLRMYMVNRQREMALHGGIVMDGRDIGSYVLPGADVKFFVTASLGERALRRQEQQAQAGVETPLDELEADIALRDEQDSNKGEHSLVRTPDAILIDTTGRSIEDVLAEMLSYCRRD